MREETIDLQRNITELVKAIDDNEFLLEAPIDKLTLQVIAFLYVVAFLFSTGLNVNILMNVKRGAIKNKSKSAYEILILALIIVNFIGTLTDYPFVIVSKFKRK
jgi:hypothetical protein